jgi:ParB family transcriptional regulator, chromosome partitioning protein
MARQNSLKDFVWGKESELVIPKEETPTQLSLASLVLPSRQPRRYFDEQKLSELTNSIRVHGILEPLLVRPLESGKYELVAGERRYRAALSLKLDQVPVVIRSLDHTQALAISLIENLQREDLNPVDEAEGILQLLAIELNQTPEQSRSLLYQMKNSWEKSQRQSSISRDNVIPNSEDNHDLKSRDNVIPNPDSEIEFTVQSVFHQLGQNWYSFTCNRLPLLNLPNNVLIYLRQGKIAYTKARAIAKLEDEKQRQQLLDEAIANSLSLSQIKQRVKEILETELPVKPEINAQQRIKQTLTRLNKSRIWEDSNKQKKLDRLLQQLEELMS